MYGAIGFALLSVTLFLYNKSPLVKKLTPAIMVAALLIDSVFISYQLLYYRCSSCHVVALLLGLSILPLLRCPALQWKPLVRGAFGVWLLLFFSVGIMIVKEVAVQPWSINGNEQASVRIFFSPTCTACEDTVRDLLQRVESGDDLALIPIAKSQKDQSRIAYYLKQKRLGNDDLNLLFADTEKCELGSKDWMCLEKNKIALSSLGASKVPLVVSTGRLPLKQEVHLPAFGIDPGLYYQPISPDNGCSIDVLEHDCSPGI